MKENWIYRKLEESIEKVKYTTKVQSSDYKGKGLYPIISQEDDMISGYWDNGSDVFKVNKPVVIFGDHTRTLKYIDFDFVLGADGVKILQPIDKLNAKFFLYYLKWCKIPSLGYSRHYKLLKEIQIPIPPLPVQERIVSELDLLSGIIEKKKEQLKEYEQLAQAIFYDMFGDPVTNEKGWEVKKLGVVCDVRDGTHDSPKYIDKSEYVLITSKNIQNGRIDFTNVNYISKKDYDNINKRSYVNDGDIIMAMIGTIGRPIIVHRNSVNFCIKNVALIKFLTNSVVLNVFVKAVLDNESYMQNIQSLNKGGTQKFVALGTLRGLPIPLPPLSLQQQFAEKIEAIEKQKELIKQSIKETETLFNSRMDYYFN